MHAWIMFLWLTGNPVFPNTITTQEFNTRQECVDAAIALRKMHEDRIGFICFEKGNPKKVKK